MMDSSLHHPKSNGTSVNSSNDCQANGKRSGAINKANGAATAAAAAASTPTRNLLRKVINNLSSSQQGTKKAQFPTSQTTTSSAAAAAIVALSNEVVPVQKTKTTTTKNQNFSNHFSNTQMRIDDDDDEFKNNKRNETAYSYTTVNSLNYEQHIQKQSSPVHNVIQNNNARSTNNRSTIRPDTVVQGLGQQRHAAPKTLPILQALNELNLLSTDINNLNDNVYEDEEEFPIIMESSKIPFSPLRQGRAEQNYRFSVQQQQQQPAPAPRPSINRQSNTANSSPKRQDVVIRSPPQTHLANFAVHASNGLSISANNSPQKASGTSSPSIAAAALPGTRRYLKNNRALGSPRRNIFNSNDNNAKSTITTSNLSNLSSPGKLLKTPSWIWKIFKFARKGQLDLLKEAVYGLDLTLIRHLVDAKGNNLLHCSARKGHIHILEWLVAILGDQFEAALNDQNASGNNVILTALKNTQLTCLQWLIVNTITGSNALTGKDGKKSLLHYVAKYDLLDAARLLCEFHVQYQITLDIQDSSFCTPLHIAAKFGNINVAQVLIQFGANPSCQTELGCKPSDLALRYHRMECMAYFRMAEAAASLGTDLQSLVTQFNMLQTHFETLRTQFRDVLRVGKCLTKERNELIKHFPFVGSKSSQEETAASASALLLGGTTNNGVRFSDLEHKLVQAEHALLHTEQIEMRQFLCTETESSSSSSSSFLKNFIQQQQHDEDLFRRPNISNKRSYILQKYLAETQPVLLQQRTRHSSGSTLLDVPSSSSEDSSNNGKSSSEDDDDDDNDYDGADEEVLCEPTYHNITQCGHLNKAAKSCSFLPTASTNTPWLLPSSEVSILSSLSPNKSNAGRSNSPMLNLDLLGKPPAQKNSSGLALRRDSTSTTPVKSSSFTSSSSIGIPVSPKALKVVSSTRGGNERPEEEEVASAVAVIEVIEPVVCSSKPNKSNSSNLICSSTKPKQTRQSSNNTPPSSSQSQLVVNNSNSKEGDDGNAPHAHHVHVHGRKLSSCDWISCENSIFVEEEKEEETGSGRSLSCAIDNEMQSYEYEKGNQRSTVVSGDNEGDGAILLMQHSSSYYLINDGMKIKAKDSSTENYLRQVSHHNPSIASEEDNKVQHQSNHSSLSLSSPKPKRRPRKRELGNYGDSFPPTNSTPEMRFLPSKETYNQITSSNQYHTSSPSTSTSSCDDCGNTVSKCTCSQNSDIIQEHATAMSMSMHTFTDTGHKDKCLGKVPIPQVRSLNSTPPTWNEQHENKFSSRLSTFPDLEIRFPTSHSLLRNPTDHSARTVCASSSIIPSTFTAPLAPPPLLPSTHPSVSESFNIESSSARPVWSLVDLPPHCSSSSLESGRSLNGHQSPSPSETESALAPPPSQISQSSDTSKTESIRGQRGGSGSTAPTAMLSREEYVEDVEAKDSNSIIINYCHVVTAPAPAPTKSPPYDSTLKMMMSGSGRRDRVDRDKDPRDNQRRADDKIDNNETGENIEDGVGCYDVVQSSITEAVKTTHSTPTISLSTSIEHIHKHNNSNNNNKEPIKNFNLRQQQQHQQKQPKPWYEMEMSDDEDEILLRIARARATQTANISSKLNSDEDENENDEILKQYKQFNSGEHQCDSTNCSQFNCPNFV